MVEKLTISKWAREYIEKSARANASIDLEAVRAIIQKVAEAGRNGRKIFVIGNGGSASNASHFATDLGKSASDAVGKRFFILSLNDNTSWITALGNDYSYDEIFSGQLKNYANTGDLLIVLSVSGSSPNLVKAAELAKTMGLHTIALIGGKRGTISKVADTVVVVEDTHYGRVEDAEMTICHMIC